MGPFALMDLIGHDVNFAVTRSVYEGLFHDPRYRPSLLQKAWSMPACSAARAGAGSTIIGRGGATRACYAPSGPRRSRSWLKASSDRRQA